MKIEKIYIGGWFQRTMLQLTEIYDFLRDGSSRLALDKKKLIKLRGELDLKVLEYESNGFEYIDFTTGSGIEVKIYEDGLIVLNDGNVSSESMFLDIDSLTHYYEKKLSPALSYLFSLGAPVPKELSNIQTVYPYFIIVNNASKDEMTSLLEKVDKQKYYEFSNEKYEIKRGDKYYFINSKTKDLQQIERYVEEQIFMREFKGQLHNYLNLHRIIWEKIADVKENAHVKGKDIVAFTDKLDGYAKTINLIDARINQMNTYLRTREKIAKSDEELSSFLEIMGYRYETLGDTLSYMQQLWKMTQNYVKQAQSLFSDLQSNVTGKSIDNLTIVTSMGVGSSLLGLFTETSLPSITIFGVVYFLILAAIGYGVTKLMKYISANRKYHISDMDYDNNIK